MHIQTKSKSCLGRLCGSDELSGADAKDVEIINQGNGERYIAREGADQLDTSGLYHAYKVRHYA